MHTRTAWTIEEVKILETRQGVTSKSLARTRYDNRVIRILAVSKVTVEKTPTLVVTPKGMTSPKDECSVIVETTHFRVIS